MLESQIQNIKVETDKLQAQLNNQGLGNQFTEGLAALREAIGQLSAAVAAIQAATLQAAVPSQPLEPPPPRTVPPDARFFQGGLVKPAPIEPDQSTAAVVD